MRVGESSCPFCGHAPPTGFVAPPYIAPRGRIGRVALLAFRAAVVSAAATTSACGASTGLDGLDASAREDAAVRSEVDAGRPARDAGALAHDAGPIDPEWDAGAVVAEYGGPMWDDAGLDAGSFVDLYGGAPDPEADASFDALYGGAGFDSDT